MSTIVPTKYVRKPLIVDAVLVTEDNFDEMVQWCQGTSTETSEGKFIAIRVHNPKTPRQAKAFVGDWVLYTDRGYKVYTPKAFLNSFDVYEQKVAVTPTSFETPVTGNFEKKVTEPEETFDEKNASTTAEEILDNDYEIQQASVDEEAALQAKFAEQVALQEAETNTKD